MGSVKEFYNLIPFKKCSWILVDIVINEDISSYDVFNIKKYLVNTMKHIAHSQAVAMYPISQKFQYKEALKELYKAEKALKLLKISKQKKELYFKELNQVRKILIVLNKKVNVEEDNYDKEA